MSGGTSLLLDSATALVKALRERTIRSVDVTRAFLERIEQGNPRVRCVTRLEAESALQQAAEADRVADAGGLLGSLHGLPMTLKDAHRVAGSRCTFGLPHLGFCRSKADCEAVARLRRAGAVFLGRTAVPFACFDWQCRPPLRRECVNPLDPARTPGGSSGGSAAALAAGFTPLELGSDVAGSIRYPAHCCGVYSLRTTVGLIPSDDVGPNAEPVYPSAYAVGPMARSLEDLALMLSVLAPEPEPRAPTPPSGKSRVAVTRSVKGLPVDAQTAAAIESVVRAAQAAGHEVVETDPPFDFDEAYSVWGLLGGYEMKPALPFGLRNRPAIRLFTAWFLFHRLGDGPLSTSFRAGMLASESEYRAGLARREQLIALVDRFLTDHPLWVMPVSPTSAIARQRSGRPIRFDGIDIPYSRFIGGYLCPTIPMSTPADVIPIAPPGGGLPVGVQVHARRFADHWLVRTLSSWQPTGSPESSIAAT
jgi:amidase